MQIITKIFKFKKFNIFKDTKRNFEVIEFVYMLNIKLFNVENRSKFLILLFLLLQ